MEATKWIWYDGQMVPWEDAKIHVVSHSLHYGSAVFEGIRVYPTENGPAIFRLQEHVDRLFYSAEALGMKVPFSNKEIFDAIVETVRKNEVDDAYIRPLIFFGYGKMGVMPENFDANVMIAVWPWPAYLGSEPLKMKTSKYIRVHPQSTVTDAKIAGNYVNSLLATMDAKGQGYDLPVMYDHEGNVVEANVANIFTLNGNKLSTPPKGNILPGITRDSVMQIAKDEGYEVVEEVLSPQSLLDSDEAFVVGTASEVAPIGSVDDKPVGKSHEVAEKLRKIYVDTVHGKVEKYKDWLTYVQ